MDPEEVAAERRAIKNTLYDSSYKTVAGHWKRRDEPGEPRKTEYLKIAPDALRKQKQWDARQRLKKMDAVPTRQGKKLFDEFMKEARHICQHSMPGWRVIESQLSVVYPWDSGPKHQTDPRYVAQLK